MGVSDVSVSLALEKAKEEAKKTSNLTKDVWQNGNAGTKTTLVVAGLTALAVAVFVPAGIALGTEAFRRFVSRKKDIKPKAANSKITPK